MNSMTLAVGNDCSFRIDSFGEPYVCSESETIKNAVMFLLFLKPGQFPSIPDLGIDIRSKLYSKYDETTDTDLTNLLISNCNALQIYIQQGSIVVRKMIYQGMPSLIINIQTDTNDKSTASAIRQARDANNKEFFIGLSVNEINQLMYVENSK